jgi:HAD superfamily hydrolase (TIGR01459 family)
VTRHASIRPIDRLEPVLDAYDAIISDVWGVLHNGISATFGAQQALARARSQGKPVVLLTNSPRLPESVARQLRELGVVEPAYDAIVSSGGMCRYLMADEGARSFFHLGPARDSGLYRDLAAQSVPFDAADFILCTGLFDDETEKPDDYRPMLEIAARRNLRFYCANPDLVVERGDRLIPCAGALADIYEQLGGTVIWVGKPKPIVYTEARRLIAEKLGHLPAKERILCIGDALRTDIAGANAEGHDSIMTLAGIHAHQIGLHGARYDLAALESLAAETGKKPTMAMVSLAW